MCKKDRFAEGDARVEHGRAHRDSNCERDDGGPETEVARVFSEKNAVEILYPHAFLLRQLKSFSTGTLASV
jgi:hypothetical protein